MGKTRKCSDITDSLVEGNLNMEKLCLYYVAYVSHVGNLYEIWQYMVKNHLHISNSPIIVYFVEIQLSTHTSAG